MLILIVRHGPAGSTEAWASQGKPDHLRPLTPKGREKTVRALAGLRKLVEGVDLIATSPYVRSKQTAQLLKRRFPKAELSEQSCLKPGGGMDKALSWLGGLKRESCVALVGHEPFLGVLASRLLSQRGGAFLRLRKGACLLLEAPAPVKPGGAALQWLLQPKQLRDIGEKV